MEIFSLNNIPKIVKRPKKRVGRGHGSGKVKTSGRGTKGQRARGKMPLAFEGGQQPLVRRLPYLRGKLRNKSLNGKPVTLDLKKLNNFPKGSTINLETLRKAKFISPKVKAVKIVGNGELKIALKIEVKCSSKAAEIIQKAGGTVNL